MGEDEELFVAHRIKAEILILALKAFLSQVPNYFLILFQVSFSSLWFSWDFLKKINFDWRIVTLQHCDGFCLTSTGIGCCIHVSLPSWPPTPTPPHPFGRLRALRLRMPSFMLWTCTGHLSYICTCLNTILSDHPTLGFSHWVQILFLCLCFLCCPASRVISAIFLNPIYVCINVQYLSFSFWPTLLCVTGFRFIYLIRTDLNALLFIAQ